MEWISWSILAIGIIFFMSSISQVKCKTKEIHTINAEIDEANRLKEERCEELEQQIKDKLNDIEKIEDKQKEKKQQLDDLQQNVTSTIDSQKKLSQVAFENYCETLLKSYDEKEKEYQDSLLLLQNSYSQEQLKLLEDLEKEKETIAQELADERKVLDKIRETRAAAIQAQLKEKEIAEELAFYCLQATDNDIKDISVLESIKPKLNNPRILSMLIWQTYQRTPMTKLCNNVIGSTVKTGIYKITNQKTKECYIGQAVDLASRWKDHAKCGLGIDTPIGNKLYKAMQEYGINNFSWEVLEICPKEQLDEKEKYYIELYQAVLYGYNGQSGNKGK